MKLEKVKSRLYKAKQYHKYRVVISEKDIDAAGFKAGDTLKVVVKKGEIKLKK